MLNHLGAVDKTSFEIFIFFFNPRPSFFNNQTVIKDNLYLKAENCDYFEAAAKIFPQKLCTNIQFC